MEYGLLASKGEELLADFLWKLQVAWSSAPWWLLVAVGFGVLFAAFLFFRER